MSDSKQPKAGEWWQYNGVRVFIVGVKLNGHVVCEYKDGNIATLTVGDWWQHLPDCDSWTWHPKSIPEIQFDPKTFTSDWGPHECYPIQPAIKPLVPPNRIPVRLWGIPRLPQ